MNKGELLKLHAVFVRLHTNTHVHVHTEELYKIIKKNSLIRQSHKNQAFTFFLSFFFVLTNALWMHVGDIQLTVANKSRRSPMHATPTSMVERGGGCSSCTWLTTTIFIFYSAVLCHSFVTRVTSAFNSMSQCPIPRKQKERETERERQRGSPPPVFMYQLVC